MIDRIQTQQVRDDLQSYPAVALIGPRQSGKTTLARSLGRVYFDLEREADRLRLDVEWDRLAGGSDLVILDEAQSMPEAFPRLRGTIDDDRQRKGRFLLLGSVSPARMVRVSESLAGRLSLVELTPFLWTEVPTEAAPDRLWLCGGYPEGGILEPHRFPRWQRNHLALLAERDLPAWGLPAEPQTTDRLLRMLAAAHGQVWNASQIGQSLGLSYHTVNSHLDYLVGAFLIRRLLPYQANIRKRLVKSPKVYWRDSGLLHALLNVTDEDALLAQPWVGASWEGFVIEQTIGVLSATGRLFDPYYFRTSDGRELDLVLDMGKEALGRGDQTDDFTGPGGYGPTQQDGRPDRRDSPVSGHEDQQDSGRQGPVLLQFAMVAGVRAGECGRSRRQLKQGRPDHETTTSPARPDAERPAANGGPPRAAGAARPCPAAEVQAPARLDDQGRGQQVAHVIHPGAHVGVQLVTHGDRQQAAIQHPVQLRDTAQTRVDLHQDQFDHLSPGDVGQPRQADLVVARNAVLLQARPVDEDVQAAVAADPFEGVRQGDGWLQGDLRDGRVEFPASLARGASSIRLAAP